MKRAIQQVDSLDFYSGIRPIQTRFPILKRTPLHPYFTSQPYSLIQGYVRHFTEPGATVLDLFGGSGTTAREALLLGRQAIHLDLMPWSCFLAKASLYRPSDLHGLASSVARLEKNLGREMKELYQLSSRAAANVKTPRDFPGQIKLPRNSDVETLAELFTPRNTQALWRLRQEIESETNLKLRHFLLFVCSGIVARASKTYWRDKAGKGGGDSGLYKVYRYWVPPEPEERNVWELFTSRLERVSKLIQRDNQGLECGARSPSPSAQVICSSATQAVDHIPQESVDYIFTDPPYAKHITYLDLSTMYHALLGLKITPAMKANEAIEGGDNAKSMDQYMGLMEQSFANAFQLLKKGRWMTVVFTHKDPQVYSRLIQAAVDSGFEFTNAIAQDTKRPSFHKVNNSPTVLKGQMMMNFCKPSAKSSARKLRTARPPLSKNKSALALILSSARKTIASHKGNASYSVIVHELYEKLLSSGFIQDFARDYRDLESILNENFARQITPGGLYYRFSEDSEIDVS